MTIDWRRVAEPQEDGYDTRVALDLVTGRVTPEHPTPYLQRRPVGFAPTLFDGQVAIRYIARQCPGHPRNLHGPLKHPNLQVAADLVRRWPVAYEQFKTLMDTVHPMRDALVPEAEWGQHIGSSSHADEDKFGTCYVTLHDPVATAEAFVHEMAHNKLRALGVYVERAYRLITNPPDQMFESPIRKDVMRPMTAVLHAQYSFIYVTALDLALIEAETDPRKIERYLVYLAYNVPRMELGYEDIRPNIRVDEDGQAFLDGFFDWTDRVLARGNEVLKEHGVPKRQVDRVFTH